MELHEGKHKENVTWLVREMTNKLYEVTLEVTRRWKNTLEDFCKKHPQILNDFVNPSVPAGCFAPGTRVQVQWPAHSMDNKTWFAASVVSVHKTGHYVVRYDIAGSWGDTERHVTRERLCSATSAPGRASYPGGAAEGSRTYLV